MCRCLLLCCITNTKILALMALFFLIVAFTLEIIYVCRLPWNSNLTGNYLIAAILGIISLALMGLKFLLHEAMVLFDGRKKMIFYRLNFGVAFIAIGTTLASAIVLACSPNYANISYQRLSWAPPGLLASMCGYYAKIGRLQKAKLKKMEMTTQNENEINNTEKNSDINLEIEITEVRRQIEENYRKIQMNNEIYYD